MDHSLPSFSVIIPTYNRPERLQQCLQALSRLNYPRERFEVIVVDDGSPVSLEPTVAPWGSQLSITLLRQPNAGPAAARNTGAAHARGALLAFTDDDCMPAPNWLRRLASRLAAAPDAMIGGKTLNALPDNPFSTASQQLISYLYAYYDVTAGRAPFFASNNIALSAALFRSVGGFDTSFPHAAGEDREFCDRWHHHGHPMVFAPEVRVYHAHKLTLRRFWRQHFNYGRGALYFHDTRAERRATVSPEPLSFYLNLLRFPFQEDPPARAGLHTALLGLAQLANAVGFFYELFQRKRAPATPTRSTSGSIVPSRADGYASACNSRRTKPSSGCFSSHSAKSARLPEARTPPIRRGR